MLRRSLGLASAALTYESLAEVVRGGGYEPELVAFRRELPSSGKEREAVACDAAALANARGGVLVFGVVEEGEQVIGLSDVSLGRDTDKVWRSLSALVAPPIAGVESVAVQGPEGTGRGVLIVTIPPSPFAPHCVMSGPQLGFWRRVGRNNLPLSEMEVERAYRERWRLRREVAGEADRLAEYIASTKQPNGCLWAVAIPLSTRGRLFRTGAQGINTVRAALDDGALRPLFARKTYWRPEARFRRVEVAESWPRRLEDSKEIAVVHDSGAVAVACELHGLADPKITVEHTLQETVREKPPTGTWYPHLLEFAGHTVALAKGVWREFGLGGEAMVRFGLTCPTRVGWVSLGILPQVTKTCHEPLECDMGLDILSLDEPGRTGAAIGEIVCDLMSGFGFPFGDAQVVNEQGALNLSFAGPHADSVAEWCRKKGLETYGG